MQNIDQILDRIETIYEAAVDRLREDVIAFGRSRELPAPERRKDLASFGLRAMAGGILVSYINACIAGLFIAQQTGD